VSTTLRKYHIDAVRQSLDALEFATDDMAEQRSAHIRAMQRRIRNQRMELKMLLRVRPESNAELQDAWRRVNEEKRGIAKKAEDMAALIRQREVDAWIVTANELAHQLGKSENEVRMRMLANWTRGDRRNDGGERA
jgi:hypothetical protein